jgi:uncharacterized protein (DUF1684 family)
MRLAFPVLTAAALLMAMSYESEIRGWREARERSLKADDGWLTVAGLFWLKEGENTFGKDAGNDIVLPDGPGRAGTFELRAGKVTVTMPGQAPRAMRSDVEGKPDTVLIKDLTMFVIKRGDRYGIRLRDKNSRMRREFTGLRWFPVKESGRVTAQFVASPSRIPVPNILGQIEQMPSPGYAEFTWEGQKLRLYPVLEEPGARELFVIFRDRTSGRETYGAGRFLYTDMPKDGKLVLDFNRAYNPPCAFTPYATCPLPPKPNQLPVRIEAGELKYADH